MTAVLALEGLLSLLQGIQGMTFTHQGATVLTDWVQSTFDADGLIGLKVVRGSFQRLPHCDTLPAFPLTLEPSHLQALRTGLIQEVSGGLLVPLGGQYRPRYGLWLRAPGRVWSGHDLVMLKMLALGIGAEVERRQAERHLERLQGLHRELLAGGLHHAYGSLLRSAVATIPGAETGSLAVREQDVFQVVSSGHYDGLDGVAFHLDETRDVWYGLGEGPWQAGIPRVLQAAELLTYGGGFIQGDTYHPQPLDSVRLIKANIAVPILYGGDVRAILNIDSLTDEEAFANDSVALAVSFAAQAALILHEFSHRQDMEAAARTDALTGLPNRRALTHSLTQLIGCARSSAQPLSVMLMDIHQFKAINDRFGHAVGDQALRRLADHLTAFLPTIAPSAVDAALPMDRWWTPQAFRWGGDEFLVLLPGVTSEDGWTYAQQLQARTAHEQIEGTPLLLDIGVATLHDTDDTGDDLFREADAAMYQRKEARNKGQNLS